jgi:CHASE3 domain sensor protein
VNRPNEYIVDRLNERIIDLEKELLDEKSAKTDMIAAEIVLAVVCFCAGCVVGAVYL